MSPATPSLRRPELLAPAGNFEKLEIAIHYGADAVYLAGKEFSLRNLGGNFDLDEMARAVRLAHAHGVKVYVACNIYPRDHEAGDLATYLQALGTIGPDALIVADPGIFDLARRLLPDMPLHVSTQANTTSTAAARFWRNQGAVRVNAARELSLVEIEALARDGAVEVETFVHGAMCVSYSGRCLLSGFMTGRESNRGQCAHPCRWEYAVVESARPGQYMPVSEDKRGTYIFNAKDLCMIDHIPELIRAGIHTFKIEGRMKGINYVAATVKTYREAIDAFMQAPKAYRVPPDWHAELDKISHRPYATGFYFAGPGDTRTAPQSSQPRTDWRFVGKVLAASAHGPVRVQVRNKITPGDPIEVLPAKGPPQATTIRRITSSTGEELPLAQPGSEVCVDIDTPCRPNDLLRRKKT